MCVLIGASVLSFGGVVSQELLNEVDVRHDHATTAIAVQSKFVHRVTGTYELVFLQARELNEPFCLVAFLYELEVALPQVCYDL